MRYTIILLIIILMNPYVVFAENNINNNLIHLSLSDLRDRKVTSVSKTPEKAHEAAAAISIITNEDIKRAGATSIAEALRLVPGLQVARMDSNKWAITSRGFTGQFSNKLLVLIDGRTVYTPLFSGVYWDIQDTILEDIDRIEIIRGPGASIWGANAVNGVINIITRSSEYTQGNYLSSTIGNEEKAIASYRNGGSINKNTHYRVFGKYLHRDTSSSGNTLLEDDEWENSRFGFRIDSNLENNSQLTIQGDVYKGYNSQPITIPSLTTPFQQVILDDEEYLGGNVLLRWKKQISSRSDLEMQTYLDFTKRDAFILEQERHVFDFDLQHSFVPNTSHKITWGTNFRYIADNLEDSSILDYTPDDRTDQLYSLFIQDKLTLLPQKLYLTLGSKFEHNSYTGFEIQPTARLAWTPNIRNTLWASVSRAVRTSSRGEHTLSLAGATIASNTLAPNTPAGFIKQIGNSTADSEVLVAYEVGYKTQITDSIYLDTTAFFNDYDSLIRFDMGTPFSVADTAIPFHINNEGSAESYGIEVAGTWNVQKNWDLTLNYTYLEMDTFRRNGDSFVNLVESDEGRSPRHQFGLFSRINLTPQLEFDQSLYYVDDLPSIGISDYIRFDTRLGWQPTENIGVSLVAQNLFDSKHPEFEASIFSSPAEIERSVFANITIKF